ncbi:MAG: hypothetical protein RIC55_20260 [Pirellulaceae bacterium]
MMNDNPYRSPTAETPPPNSDRQRITVNRPIGVTILAVLHLLGGALLFVSQFLLLANLDTLDESFQAIGISPVLVLGGLMLLACLATASGVGMWIGAKWGWWLASFYYVYSVFRNASAMMTIVAMTNSLAAIGLGPEEYLLKHAGRMLIHFLLLLYFFKSNVLYYFGLEQFNKAKAIGILVGICLGIAATTWTIGLISR